MLQLKLPKEAIPVSFVVVYFALEMAAIRYYMSFFSVFGIAAFDYFTFGDTATLASLRRNFENSKDPIS